MTSASKTQPRKVHKFDNISEQRNFTELNCWKVLPRNKRAAKARQIADQMQKLELSDPFVFIRAYNNLLNNVTTPECYSFYRG